MSLSRRQFMATSLAASLPFGAWATTATQIGNFQIDTLSDGNLVLPGSFALGDTPTQEALDLLAKYDLNKDRFEPPCNLTLLRDGTNTILFDAGAGPDFMPSAGKLMDAFDTLNLTPEDITHVVFSHAHPDHIGGLLDDFDDPMFPEATHLIGKSEFDYWINPNTVDTIDPNRTTFAVGAKRRLEAVDDMLETFNDGDEILPGIAARATFGHTPGHMAFELAGGAMIVGDAIVNHHMAFERPEWPSGSDQNPEQGIITRLSLLDQLSSEKLTLIGYHLPGGGIGHAEKSGSTYRFITEDS